MTFWEELDTFMEEYKDTSDPAIMDMMLEKMKAYLWKCAENSCKKATGLGVFIPFEDFYSNYLFSVWKGLKDYTTLTGYTLKNVLVRRIQYSEKETWNNYKKITYDYMNKKESSYVAAKWEGLSDYYEVVDHGIDIEKMVEIKDSIVKLKEVDSNCAEFLEMKILGYSSSEAALLLGLGQQYDTSTRKRTERLKNKINQQLFKQ